MNIADFLSLFKDVKKVGDGWITLCPAHEDNDPSLSISEGEDKRILVKCHAGCSVNDICMALGIEVKDLFPQKPKVYASGKGPVVAIYDYHNVDGSLL